VPAFTDKLASQQLEAKLVKEAELAQAGVVDRYEEHRNKPLIEHINDFQQHLLAKGNTKDYVELVISRAKRTVCGCKFATWADIQPSRIQQYLMTLQNCGEGISKRTSNFYLQAIKQFCRWMVQDKRADESPLEHLKVVRVLQTDIRHPRRALEPDEIRRLLETSQNAPERFGMTGPERSMLYRLAIESGLRRNELRSLKVSSFDFENCTVSVKDAYSKNRRKSIVSLRKDTVASLQVFLANKMPSAQVFDVPKRTAEMIRADLENAGIPYVEEGFFFDFHAQRHETSTLLAASGCHPKTAQSHMRHSDINLTMTAYGHTLTGQEAAAVDALPDLSLPSSEKQIATGTDGKSADEGRGSLKKWTPKWTPELTPTAYSEYDELSSGVSQSSCHPKGTDHHKHIISRELETKRQASSPLGTSQKTERAGFEPAVPKGHTGFRNRLDQPLRHLSRARILQSSVGIGK